MSADKYPSIFSRQTEVIVIYISNLLRNARSFENWGVCNCNREVKFDVYGKLQTAKIKLLPSVFSSLYSRTKIFVFAVNSKRHFAIFV